MYLNLGAATLLVLLFGIWLLSNSNRKLKYLPALTILWTVTVCLSLPGDQKAVYVAVGLLDLAILDFCNRVKISKTRCPVTTRDFTLVASNSSILNNAAGIGTKTLYTSIFGLVIINGTALALVAGSIWSDPDIAQLAILAAVLIAGKLMSQAVVTEINRFLGAGQHSTIRRLKEHQGSLEFNAMLSTEIGELLFLIYFYNSRASLLRDSLIIGETIDNELFAPALNAYRGMQTRPNIVAVQIESGFNPNWAFKLHVENPLFHPHKHSKIITPVRVNIVGGGSWISEFEFLSGIDSRLFGADGIYTHLALPKVVKKAFPAFLRDHGYFTNTLYSAGGDFYEARSAYAAYGFEAFWDAIDLKIGTATQWSKSDLDMSTAFINRVDAFPDQPFFSYIVTNGAHSPFPELDDGRNAPGYVSHGTTTPEERLQLDRYLALLDDSATAVESIRQKLEAITEETKRPYVLAVYGDHQPHTFVQTGSYRKSVMNFAGIRTDRPLNQTFAHIMASSGSFSGAISDEIPLTMLPSLLSTIALPGERPFMPINFFLKERFGSDMLRSEAGPLSADQMNAIRTISSEVIFEH